MIDIKLSLLYAQPSAESGDATNAQIQSYERSMTPLLQDFMDPSMYYFPNSYPYFYGSKLFSLSPSTSSVADYKKGKQGLLMTLLNISFFQVMILLMIGMTTQDI